jgi:hypothetical protein
MTQSKNLLGLEENEFTTNIYSQKKYSNQLFQLYHKSPTLQNLKEQPNLIQKIKGAQATIE